MGEVVACLYHMIIVVKYFLMWLHSFLNLRIYSLLTLFFSLKNFSFFFIIEYIFQYGTICGNYSLRMSMNLFIFYLESSFPFLGCSRFYRQGLHFWMDFFTDFILKIRLFRILYILYPFLLGIVISIYGKKHIMI